jgi:DNA-binding beta-propeller fold protein YncE
LEGDRLGTGGELVKIDGEPAPAGSGASGISITPDQRFLYVPSFGEDQVHADGTRLYVSNFDASTLSSFKIGSAGRADPDHRPGVHRRHGPRLRVRGDPPHPLLTTHLEPAQPNYW